MNEQAYVGVDDRTSLARTVAAVAAGGLVAVVGGLVAFMGALSCMAGCRGVTPGIVVAFAGSGILATSPLVIARVARREGWIRWGALGIGAGVAAFFLARSLGALMGFTDAAWTIVYPSIGLGWAVALPASSRAVLPARVVGVFVLSMVPALIHDGGVLVRWVVHNYPDGSRMEGWEDHGGFLVRLTLAGVLVGLLLPDSVVTAVSSLRHRSIRGGRTVPVDAADGENGSDLEPIERSSDLGGEELEDRTRTDPALWPSDHAAVAVDMRVPKLE